MFSKLYDFCVGGVRERVKEDAHITLVMARDRQFGNMSRGELLALRDAAFGLANDITAHVTAQDLAE